MMLPKLFYKFRKTIKFYHENNNALLQTKGKVFVPYRSTIENKLLTKQEVKYLKKRGFVDIINQPAPLENVYNGLAYEPTCEGENYGVILYIGEIFKLIVEWFFKLFKG